MDIIARTSSNGKTIGFVVSDDGIEYEVLERGLYTEMILTALTSSGYKVLDYHGNIINANGISILDLTVRPTSADEDEMQMMIDESEQALTEPECVKYFTHDTRAEEIKFLEPVNPEIKTRDELVSYLNTCFLQYRTAKACYDVRPLNSFVAKEALFDISEVAGSKDVRQLFYIMSLRRKLSSHGAYRNLVEYLMSQGVLKSDTPTPTEFLEAYTAWGVDGLKTSCYKRALQFNVDGEIGSVNEVATTQNLYANRQAKLALMDKNGVLYCDGTEVEGYDIMQWNREPVVPSSEDVYNDYIAKSRVWDRNYKIIPVLVTPKRDRLYFDFINEGGFPYTVKVQHDRICMFNSYQCFLDQPYVIIKGSDNQYMTLDEAATKKDYFIRNLCSAKAYSLVSSVTKSVPVQSSYDLCRKEGLNPEAAIKYLARRMKENVYDCTSTAEYSKTDFWLASELYRTGPTQELIDKYNPEGESYSNVDELISIMLDKQSQMINDGVLQIVESKGDHMSEDNEMRLKPLESLAFVKSCFDEEVFIEFLGDGLRLDEGDSVKKIAGLISTAVKKWLGFDADITVITEFIKNIDTNPDIDILKVIKQRDNAYKGYLKDRAILNGRRGAESNYIFYVTKIFREMANVSAEECRHYAVEVFALDVREKVSPANRKTQIAIANAVTAASEISGWDREMKWIVDKQKMDIASKIFVGLIFKSLEVMKKDGDSYVDVPVGDGRKLRVILSDAILTHVRSTNWSGCFKYITLCDYCMNEIATNSKFGFYCINADIDPWFVRPKDGFSIPEYNFFVNFCDPNWFETFSEGWKQQVNALQAKPNTIFNVQISANIVNYSDEDIENDRSTHDGSTIDVVLDEVYGETMGLYRKRFQLHNTDAKKRGEYLRRMRLKSDVRFLNFADKCNAPVVEDDEYLTLDIPADASLFVKEVQVRHISERTGYTRIDTSKCQVKEFNISDYSYEEAMRWYPLLSGTFVPLGVCYVYNGFIMLIGVDGKPKTVRFAEVDKEVMSLLVADKHSYQMSADEFYLPAVNGNFVIQIK